MADLFPELRDMSILDLGGRVDTWSRAPFHPKHVHIVNLETDPILGEIPDWAEVSYGDACAPPEEIAVRRYDLALWTGLIDKTQMRHYFPDAKFRNEKVLGLAKSLIAYRGPDAGFVARSPLITQRRCAQRNLSEWFMQVSAHNLDGCQLAVT